VSVLRVVRAGARTSVEDLGRAHTAHAGVPAGGAFDPVALVAANRLVGNPDDSAGLEVTLVGPELEHRGEGRIAIALTGADFRARIASPAGDERSLRRGVVALLSPGERLRLGAARDGARAWLALAGGVAVPRLLGSRSTCVAGGFGGLHGRPLHSGDVLSLGPVASDPSAGSWPHAAEPPRAPDVTVLRILPGPQMEIFPAEPLSALESTLWDVDPRSDRTGLRLFALDPAGRRRLAGIPGVAPEGTTLGAIQVPPDGSAIVLGPDRPVTGGYAKPALVARADIGAVACLRPGDRVRFARIGLEEAIALVDQREAGLPPKAKP
jgi:biotin-dependent carboxylase-like uncharacterized protein